MKPATACISIFVLLSGSAAYAADCVVLLHGLIRTSSSMNRMQDELQDDGYFTANIDYPSRHHEIAELATIAVSDGLARCRASGRRPVARSCRPRCTRMAGTMAVEEIVNYI